MITVRAYLISMVAVFLALGIGVVAGATFIDQLTVDALNNRIDRVERNLTAREAEQQRLQARLDESEAYAEESSVQLVTEQLRGVPTILVVERGVDDGAVGAARDLVSSAGADLSGIVWLEDDWRLDDDATRERLADILGSTDDDPAELRQAGWRAVGRLLGTRLPDPVGSEGASVEGSSTSTSTTVAADGLLAALADAGFVSWEPAEPDAPLPDGSEPRGRVLVVSGIDSELDGGALTPDLVRAFHATDVAMVVAEVATTDGERGGVIDAVREDDDVDRDVSTVDALDLAAGRVAAVLALRDLADGTTGHYGYADGASSVLPASSSS